MNAVSPRLALLLFILSPWPGGLFGLGQSSATNEARVDQLIRTNNVGVAFMEQLKFKEAASQFEKVLQLDENFVPGYVNLGIARFYSQQYAEALQALEEALSRDTHQIRALYMSGLIYRNQGDPDRALEAFQRVVALDPEDPSSNYFLGLLYRREGDFEKAARYLSRTIQAQPYNASARYNLAMALQRSGQTEKASRQMQEFQRLQGQFGTDTIGLQYLEQGQYARVIDQLDTYFPGTSAPADESAILFREVSSTAGLAQSSRLGATTWKIPSGDPTPEALANLGSGTSIGDFDGDGWLDLLVCSSSQQTTSRLFRNVTGHFEDHTSASGLMDLTVTTSGTWGDFNNDGLLDLYVVRLGPNRLYMNAGGGVFEDATHRAGVGDRRVGLGATAVDFDHDGDLDIYVANVLSASKAARSADDGANGGSSNVLYRNNGDGSFSEVAGQAGVSGSEQTVSVLAFDFNNSRDVDLMAINADSPSMLFSNLRDGTFRTIPLQTSSLLRTAAIGDLNRDGFMDVVAGFSHSPGAAILWNEEGRSFREATLFTEPDTRVAALQLFDADNDGDLDVAILAEQGTAEHLHTSVRLFQNRRGTFLDVSEKSGLGTQGNLALRGMSIADYDNDGDLDIVVSVNQSLPLLFRNDSENANRWFQVELKGTNSNRSGFGTKVELLAGRLWQKSEALGGNGSMSQNPPILHFGLGSETPDALRLLWPGGVLQTEINPASNTRLSVQELDRKGTSCPILYVWNGSQYQFQTDFLGGSAFGSLLAPGTYNIPDTGEFIKIERDQLALRDGKLAITLNNQLEEVIFFDKLELLLVDHPADFEVYPDEKLLPGPPYEPFRLLTFQGSHPPAAAHDSQGRDVLDEISRIDRVYPRLFHSLPFKGYADLHELRLDLGKVSGDRITLLAYAWIDYPDSTSNLAASQAGTELVPPFVQVKNEKGEWVTVLDRMGFPAGLPKPMTVDLTGKFLSSSREIRIVTNMRIYWDQILVDSSEARRDFEVTRLQPSYADLHFLGFPELSSSDGKMPPTYHYERRSPTAQWKVHIGAYTRYGSVLPLLDQIDDMYVVTRSGDEIEALFELEMAPPLRDGWVRDYIIFVDGFGKDMDVNSAAPDFVGPLPFHDMKEFPYPESAAPGGIEHTEYLRNWNTRTVEEWFPSLSRQP